MTESEKYLEENCTKADVKTYSGEFYLINSDILEEYAKLYHKEQLEAKITELEENKLPLSKNMPSRDYSNRSLFNGGLKSAIKTLKA